jgi:hypothetical protein
MNDVIRRHHRTPPTHPLRRIRRLGGSAAGPLLLAVTLAACTSGAASSATPSATAPASAVTSSGAPTPAASVSVPSAVLAPLIADAASRTGIAGESITVVEAEAVTWPTGALGCPTPGDAYTQALVNGWRVILLAGGTRIDYRASGPDRFRVCEGIAG